MKLTRSQLAQIVKEELASILKEDYELYDEMGEFYDTYDSLEALQAELVKTKEYGMNIDDFEVKFPDGTRKSVHELREGTSKGNVPPDSERVTNPMGRIPDSNFKSIDTVDELEAILFHVLSRFDSKRMKPQEVIDTLKKVLTKLSLEVPEMEQ